MNSLIGAFNLAATVPPSAETSAPTSVLIRPGESHARDDGRLAIRTRATTAAMILLTSGSRTLLIVGGPRWASGNSAADSFLTLMNGLATRPAETLRDLRGPFILLFVDSAKGELVFATDRAATRSPCYALPPGRVLFGLTAQDVMQAGDERPAVRPQGIYDYLYFHVIPAPATLFEGVCRLQPGEYLQAGHGQARVASYWQPEYETPRRKRVFSEAKAEFRHLLHAAVQDQLGDGSTGSFLSGGTDSSTIAGVLSAVSGQPVDTYSIGFAVDGFDEIAYARIAANHFGARHHIYYMTPDDLLESVSQLAASYDQPFGNSSAVATHQCALQARADGIDKLLGGDGGDELFGGNTRYAKQQIFDAYRLVPDWMAHGLIEPGLLGVAATRRIPLVKKARSYVEQALVPMPARLQSYNLLSRIGVEQIFQERFLDSVAVDEPGQLEGSYYARSASTSLVNRMLHFDWKFTLADNDLPKVVGSCDLAGVRVGFPMLDERIVDFANALPADWKVRHLKLRHFFKAALADFLPPEIITKKKHGFGLPFGQWLTQHPPLQRLATGSLESIRDRGIVRPQFIDELMQPRMQEHATFYGELVWVLIMLELWFAAHRPDYRFA